MRNRMLNAERHACRFQAAIGPSIAPGARRLKRDVALWRQSPRQTKSNPFFETLFQGFLIACVPELMSITSFASKKAFLDIVKLEQI